MTGEELTQISLPRPLSLKPSLNLPLHRRAPRAFPPKQTRLMPALFLAEVDLARNRNSIGQPIVADAGLNCQHLQAAAKLGGARRIRTLVRSGGRGNRTGL